MQHNMQGSQLSTLLSAKTFPMSLWQLIRIAASEGLQGQRFWPLVQANCWHMPLTTTLPSSSSAHHNKVGALCTLTPRDPSHNPMVEVNTRLDLFALSAHHTRVSMPPEAHVHIPCQRRQEEMIQLGTVSTPASGFP
jgi:hypothetical protein